MAFCRQDVDNIVDKQKEGTAHDTLSPLFLMLLYPVFPRWNAFLPSCPKHVLRMLVSLCNTCASSRAVFPIPPKKIPPAHRTNFYSSKRPVFPFFFVERRPRSPLSFSHIQPHLLVQLILTHIQHPCRFTIYESGILV